ncbi:hypothetical protein G6F55_014484 [Rhizopus delemar]|nr:hypothetical protein G6F55_014484 [Rhizopus delemar]
MPPALLAQPMASAHGKPIARDTASVASTVSPAPDTSNTSCACASMWSRPVSVNNVMPCSERVTSKASRSRSARKRCARSVNSASEFQRPTACCISERFGVTSVAPR